MAQSLRIGARIGSNDPFWVQVRESVIQTAQQLGVQLVPIDIGQSSKLAQDEYPALLEELIAQDLDALVTTYLPDELTYQVLSSGLPVVQITESDVRHPLFTSPSGFYDIAQSVGQYLVEQLHEHGRVLVIGGLLAEHGEDGRSRLAGIRATLAPYPHMAIAHVPSAWRYERAYEQIYDGMQQLSAPVDAIFGLSDSLALAGRDAAQQLGLLHERTIIVGINGDPAALAAISEGSMSATIETSAADFGCQAVTLACQAAQGAPLPTHFGYKPRLVTPRNVGEVATEKLVAIASLPNRLVGVNHQHDQQQLVQLRASLEISRRVGSILDHQQLAREVADVIRASYGYDHVQLFHWNEQEQVLKLATPCRDCTRAVIPLAEADLLAEALARNAPIFVPDTYRSHRFPPDPAWPNTHSRVVLPIRLGERVLGLLDLHSHAIAQRTRQELVGLQSLADQLGVAMRNAELYGEALAARAAAEKANQLKSRLLATVSHELRTPLNIILGYSEAALATAQPYNGAHLTQLTHDLQHVRHNSVHLIRLINDLLDFSRAEIGALDLCPEMTSPRALLEEVFHTMADRSLLDSDVEWRLDLPLRLPMLAIDLVRLRQVLLNLLSNAQKFTASGHITLGAAVMLPYLHLWVQDTGSGVPADLQEQIFEPFVTGQRGGVGLGLSIAHHLVMLHGGSMTLESQHGQGSTFHMYLPLPGANAPATAPAAAESILLLVSSHEQPTPAIAELSQRQGLTIHRLTPNDDIAATLERMRPAALAWDTTHASEEDWATVQRIQSHPQWRHIPLMLFSHEDDAHVSSGVTSMLIKPLSSTALQEAVSALQPRDAEGSILIIDDDPQACDVYQRIIAEALPEHSVRIANGGVAALASLLHETPSLVILDLLMPDVDGFAVLEHLRTSPHTHHVPVLVLSGQMLSAKDVERLDHAHVTWHSKDMLSSGEIVSSVQRALHEEAIPQQTSTLVKHAVAYIQQHHARSLSRQDIARSVGISQNYLSDIFQREMGISLWEYVCRYRIKRAKSLLRNTNENITAVAAQVGFEDPAYFSRVFRKQVGCSPQHFREQLY
ncbi:MAG TPA: ATP-binding protein [Roseiflexaceae bacterium]|nr:ATP-binding protein [Roseiflexaceae bacterium]